MLNTTTLIGNLGKDPEESYTPSGVAVSKFSMATTKTWTKDGEKQSKTTWHNITAYNKLAEICNRYLSKGKQISVQGEINNYSYEKNEETRYGSEVIIKDMQMLGSKGDNETSNTSDSGGNGGGSGSMNQPQDDMSDVPF